jgi:protocatechuate 3,4-dioxygenase beta subunit
MKRRSVIITTVALALLGLALWSLTDSFRDVKAIEPDRFGVLDAPSLTADVDNPSNPTRTTLQTDSDSKKPETSASSSVTVSVIWSHDRRPVVGVCVCLTRTSARPARMAPRAVTNTEGRAHFADLEPGCWFAHASITVSEPVQVIHGSPAEIELELPEFGVMDGRVIDNADALIAGASVFATGGWLVGISEIARTDASGRFSYKSFGPNVGLFAVKEGHGRSEVIEHLSFPGDHNTATLVLGRGARPLSFVVVDDANEPVARARVTIRMSSPASLGYPIGFAVPELEASRTAANGRVSIANVLPGQTHYVVRASGFVASTGWYRHGSKDDSEIRVEMRRALVIRGSVRDSRGRPVVGARVSLGKQNPVSGIVVSTSALGEFELNAHPGVEHALVAEHEDHGYATTTLDPGQHRWDATLDPGLVIAGRVVDASGSGLTGWRVTAYPDDGGKHPHPRQPRVRTNSTGHFRVLGCSYGEHNVEVSHGGTMNAAVRARATGVLPGQDLRLIVLPSTKPSAYIKGRILRPEGFEDQLVRLAVHTESWNEMIGVPSNGEFRFGPLTPGDYRLRAIAYRTPLGGLDLGPFQIKAGEARDIGTHALETPTVVRLHPTRPDGRPVKSLRVKWRGDDGKEDSCLWSTGVPLFHRNFQPGRYKFEFHGMDHMPVALETEIRAGVINELNVRLVPARRCTLRLRRREGSALPPRVSAQLRYAGRNPETDTIVIHNGVLRLPLLPGSYRVTILANHGITGNTEFVVSQVSGPMLEVVVDVK